MANTKIPVELSSTPGIVDNSNATAITIDSSENVGIKEGSPSATLHTNSGTGNIGIHQESTDSGSYISFSDNSTTSISHVLLGAVANDLVFNAGDAERMRIDSSGNLLVGKTSTAFGTAGVRAVFNGQLQATADGNEPLGLNRLSSDGSLIDFYKDTSTVGSIGTLSGLLGIGNGDAGLLIAGSVDAVAPYNASTNATRDAAIDLGTATNRWKDLYLSGSVTTGDGTAASPAIKVGDNDTGLFQPTDNVLAFSTWGSERMRIDSSGNLLVGLTSSSNLFAVSSNGVRNDLYVTTGGNVGAYSLGTGTVTCSSGILSFSSDERLKIADGVLSGGLDKVMQIVPQYFYWRDENGDKDQQRPRELGFFAQNIQTICGQEVAPDPHREDLFLGINDRGVMAVLVKAIQEQQTQIEALQSEINELKNS